MPGVAKEQIAYLNLRSARSGQPGPGAFPCRLQRSSPRRDLRPCGGSGSPGGPQIRWRAALHRESRACGYQRDRHRISSTCSDGRIASCRSSRRMPLPSSETRISVLPPAAVTISICLAPASTAFSTSSLDDTGGPFDHLPGCDLVDHLFAQLSDCHETALGLLRFAGFAPRFCSYMVRAE